MRDGRKSIEALLQSSWDGAVAFSESLNSGDLKLLAVTRELYRSAYIRFLIPMLILRGWSTAPSKIPPAAWEALANSLLLFKDIEKSRHQILSKVWGFFVLICPEQRVGPARAIYVENYKILVN